MANIDLIKTIEKNISSLEDDDFKNLLLSGGTVAKWQNQEQEEIENLLQDTLSTLKKSLEENLFESLPINILTGINNGMNAFYTQYIPVKSLSQITSQHHASLNQMQSVNQQLRNSGIYALAALGPDIEAKRISIDEQLSKVSQANADILKLEEQIKSLINPATADSLSSAFDLRRQKISRQKWIWAIIVGFSVGIAMFVTYDITNSITELVQEISTNKPASRSDIPLVWFMRVLLLAPAYFLVLFSFKQYVRERMLEENYAHKSAIAQTLPSYSELVTDSTVRDEITSSATKVAFELPKASDQQVQKSSDILDKISSLSKDVEKLLKIGLSSKSKCNT